jgi:hypothetical protein
MPAALNAIEHDTTMVGFTMISESRTGALLRTLAASKPGGALLELGDVTRFAKVDRYPPFGTRESRSAVC